MFAIGRFAPVTEGGCTSDKPGHTVHPIQARLIEQEPRLHTLVEVIGFDGDILTVVGADGVLRFHNHRPSEVEQIVREYGIDATLVGYHALRLASRHVISILEVDGVGPTPCVHGL
jgi:hypothetical protein